jgi:hypothetical protein
MKISQGVIKKENGTVRAEAIIEWENNKDPPSRLFIQTEEKFQSYLWPDPNAFLIACVLSAWRAGEERIVVIGSLCPMLHHQLKAPFNLLKSWYPDDFGPPPTIECTDGFVPLRPASTGSACLLSCGIDSIASIRANLLQYPRDHPFALKAGILISHVEEPLESREALIKAASGRFSAAKEIAADARIDAIPVCTNIWWMNPDGYFFSEKSHGAQLSAIASFFSKGFQRSYIGSSFPLVLFNRPWGSHPLLDNYFSTTHFQIVHHGMEMTRLDKTKLVADWPIALQNIRVCQNDNSGTTNCGTCEKCIRTMITLAALGKLDEKSAFPSDDVDVDLLDYLIKYDMINRDSQEFCYREILPILEVKGRNDLSRKIQSILSEYRLKKISGVEK